MIYYNKFRGNSANYILKFKVAEKSAPKIDKAVLKQLSRQTLFMTTMHTNRSFNFSFPDKTVPSCIAYGLEHKYTHYDCPGFCSSTSISLLHLHHFCPLVFLIFSQMRETCFFLILVLLV